MDFSDVLSYLFLLGTVNPYVEAYGSLLFVHTHLLVKGSHYAVITRVGSKSSHLKAYLQRWQPALTNYYWLLLLAGDVEVNPGPSHTAHNSSVNHGACARCYSSD